MKELHEGGDHAHNHEGCGCGHDHHDHGEAPDMARMIAFLEYLAEHNSQHAGEVGSIAHQFSHTEESVAAALLRSAARDFETGTMKIAEALAFVKRGR